jgi:hypothetical protein
VTLKWIGMALLASLAFAQSQTGKTSTLKFELTSVRQNNSPNPDKALVQFLPGGRFVSTNVPLIRVIAAAWGLPLQTQRLTLGSGVRMPDEVYDIEATSPKGVFSPGHIGGGTLHPDETDAPGIAGGAVPAQRSP